MRKVLLTILLCLLTTSAFAMNVTQTGHSYPIKTKTYTTSGVDETLTDEVVWTPTTGTKIVLVGASFSSDVATEFKVEQGTTSVIPSTQATASGSIVIGNGTPIWKGSDNQTLTLTTNSAGQHSILLWGYEAD